MKKLSILLCSLLLIPAYFVFASTTNGTINSTNRYAWSQNIGWIDFGCEECNIAITDFNITGRAWSATNGWIDLEDVKNTRTGDLSGTATGEKTGSIDFSDVSIDDNGYFRGYANGEITGLINFNCTNTNSCSISDFKVSTDWKPYDARANDVPKLIPSNILVTASTASCLPAEGTTSIAFNLQARNASNYIISENQDFSNAQWGSLHAYTQQVLITVNQVKNYRHYIKFRSSDGFESSVYFTNVDVQQCSAQEEITPTTEEVRIAPPVCEIPKNFPYLRGKALKTQESPKVYLFNDDGCKSWLVNEEAYFEHFSSWDDITIVDMDTLDQLTNGDDLMSSKEAIPTTDEPSTTAECSIPKDFPYETGVALKSTESPKVYLYDEHGCKRYIVNEKAFLETFPSWTSLKTIDAALLNKLVDGENVEESN